MKRMHKTLGAFLLMLGSLTAQAQETRSFSLEDAKSHALEHHLDIVNAQHDVDFAQQQIVETRGMGLPQIDISGKFNHFINIPVTVVDATAFNPSAPPGTQMEFEMGTEYSANGTIQATQLIFNGSYIVGLQTSKLFKGMQQLSAETTKEEVIFNVIKAYQMAAVAKENLAFADSMVMMTQKLIDEQQHVFDAGLILQEDMDQLSYSLLTAKNASTSANVQYQNALGLLKFSMGYPMDASIEISQSTSELLDKQIISTGSVENNLSLNLMERRVKLSEMSVKNNKMANVPSLSAFFNHQYNAYRNEFNFFEDERWFPQTVWGLQLNIPVFSGLRRHAKIKQSKIQLMKDQNTLESMKRGLQLQEIQYKNNLNGAESKYNLQRDNVDLAKSIYKNAITKQEIGKDQAFMVTQKHNQLLIAQSQYLGSLVELFQAKLDLNKLYNELLSNK